MFLVLSQIHYRNKYKQKKYPNSHADKNTGLRRHPGNNRIACSRHSATATCNPHGSLLNIKRDYIHSNRGRYNKFSGYYCRLLYSNRILWHKPLDHHLNSYNIPRTKSIYLPILILINNINFIYFKNS